MNPYELYDIVITFKDDPNKDENIAVVSVGFEAPAEGSEDDEATFFHFTPEEWESLQDNFEFETPVEFGDFIALRNAPE